jgi:dTDP-glucose 4,6-dehydratase
MPFIRTNVEGTATLLEAARSAWSGSAGNRMFLHVSTDEVFGSLEPGDPPFSETSPHRPNSPYAASKAAADQLARAWSHTYALPVIVSNCSNNYGPMQFPEKLIPLMILNAIEGRELPLYGDGGQVRDWLHVSDHCRALLSILQRGRPGATYTVGGRCQRTNLQIVRLICSSVDELLGRAAGTSAELIRHVADRPGHDRRYAMDPSRLCAETGWAPQTSLDHSLPDLVRWYYDNREWADAIRSGDYRSYYSQLYEAR